MSEKEDLSKEEEEKLKLLEELLELGDAVKEEEPEGGGSIRK